ncbi:30S ribosomal protein S15 [Candidatus Micrarchaeota archaeon]|nr:30S ribosomal protein S15 [Candidatus Micrarchaeota archaeon]
MARMHSRKRGSAGSSKPQAKNAPSWVESSKEEVTEKIIELARQGTDPAQIGRTLRDKHGIPSTRGVTGRKISQILEKNKLLQYPSDLIHLIRKAVGLRKHLKNNKQDHINKAMLDRTESKVKRLVKYYRRRKLPADWKYDPESAALLVK